MQVQVPHKQGLEQHNHMEDNTPPGDKLLLVHSDS